MRGGIFLLLLVIIPVVIIVIFTWQSVKIKPDQVVKIKPGQVWEYVVREKNPFEERLVKTQTILDVKDGYVKYSYRFSNGSGVYEHVRVEEEGFFRIGNKMIAPLDEQEEG